MVHRAAALIQIFFDIAVGGLVLNTGHGACLEHVGFAEQLLCIAVHIGLIFAGKVQVDIRLFIAVEAQEGLEGNVVAVH